MNILAVILLFYVKYLFLKRLTSLDMKESIF